MSPVTEESVRVVLSLSLTISHCLSLSLTVSFYVCASLSLSVDTVTIMPTMSESGKSDVTYMTYQTYESCHKHQLTGLIAYGPTQETARSMDTVAIMPTKTAALRRVRQRRVGGSGVCHRSREIRRRVR